MSLTVPKGATPTKNDWQMAVRDNVISITLRQVVVDMTLKSETRDLLEELCSGKKSIDLSRIWAPKPWISRRARYPETTETDTPN